MGIGFPSLGMWLSFFGAFEGPEPGVFLCGVPEEALPSTGSNPFIVL